MERIAYRKGIFGIFFSMVLSIALCALPAAAEERLEPKDTDSDGKPDEWRVYAGDRLIRVDRNRNRDGAPEIHIFMEADKPVRAEVDRNNDGKPDMFRSYVNGKPDKEHFDLNFDGKPDAWVFYKEGSKDLVIRDKNLDGKPDTWFYYGESGIKTIGGKADENFDGVVDKTFGSVPEKESRVPW